MPQPTCRPMLRLPGLRGMRRWLGLVIRTPRGRLPCKGPRPRQVGCRALRRPRRRLPLACLARGLPPQLSTGVTSPRGTRRSWLRVRPWRPLPQSHQGCHFGQACCRWCLLPPGEGRRDFRSPHRPHALIHTRQLGRRPARITFMSRLRGPLRSCLRLTHSAIVGRRRPWPNCSRRSRHPRSRIFLQGLWCIASLCRSSNNARPTRLTTERSSALRRRSRRSFRSNALCVSRVFRGPRPPGSPRLLLRPMSWRSQRQPSRFSAAPRPPRCSRIWRVARRL